MASDVEMLTCARFMVGRCPTMFTRKLREDVGYAYKAVVLDKKTFGVVTTASFRAKLRDVYLDHHEFYQRHRGA